MLWVTAFLSQLISVESEKFPAEAMTAWRYQTHHSVPVLYVSIKVIVNEMKETIQAYGQTNACHWPFVMGADIWWGLLHFGAILNVNVM